MLEPGDGGIYHGVAVRAVVAPRPFRSPIPAQGRNQGGRLCPGPPGFPGGRGGSPQDSRRSTVARGESGARGGRGNRRLRRLHRLCGGATDHWVRRGGEGGSIGVIRVICGSRVGAGKGETADDTDRTDCVVVPPTTGCAAPGKRSTPSASPGEVTAPAGGMRAFGAGTLRGTLGTPQGRSVVTSIEYGYGSLLPVPYSLLLPIPYSLLPIPYSLTRQSRNPRGTL